MQVQTYQESNKTWSREKKKEGTASCFEMSGLSLVAGTSNGQKLHSSYWCTSINLECSISGWEEGQGGWAGFCFDSSFTSRLTCCHTYSCWSGSRGASKPGSYLLASLPPLQCLWMGKSEGSLWSSRLGSSLCRRETALTEEVSSSYKISAFRYSSTLAAAVWKCLQSAAAHGLNFHHEKPVTPPACAVAPCTSCLLAQWWHLHPCFSDW